VAAAKAEVDLVSEDRRLPRVPFPLRRRPEAYDDGPPGGVITLRVLHEGLAAGGDRALHHTGWDGVERSFGADDIAQVVAANDAMAAAVSVSSAVARKRIDTAHPDQDEAERSLELLGLLAMSDPPRPEVRECRLRRVHRARHPHLHDHRRLRSHRRGDRPSRRSVAPGALRVVSGHDMDEIDDEGLARLLSSGQQVLFARAEAEHKMRIVAAAAGARRDSRRHR